MLLLFSLLLLPSLRADTPVHCLYEDTIGEWILHIGSRGHDKNLYCGEKLGLIFLFLTLCNVKQNSKISPKLKQPVSVA